MNAFAKQLLSAIKAQQQLGRSSVTATATAKSGNGGPGEAPGPLLTTTPELTPDTRAADQQLGVSPPGAGGWTPKPGTVYLVSSISAACAALAISLPQVVTGQTGLILGAVMAALAAGGGTFVATRSAGPRKPTA